MNVSSAVEAGHRCHDHGVGHRSPGQSLSRIRGQDPGRCPIRTAARHAPSSLATRCGPMSRRCSGRWTRRRRIRALQTRERGHRRRRHGVRRGSGGRHRGSGHPQRRGRRDPRRRPARRRCGHNRRYGRSRRRGRHRQSRCHCGRSRLSGPSRRNHRYGRPRRGYQCYCHRSDAHVRSLRRRVAARCSLRPLLPTS